MTFFQTLATCHTVQVAGDDIEDVLADTNANDTVDNSQSDRFHLPPQIVNRNDAQTESVLETLQKITTFSNIREESESTHSITHLTPPPSAASCEHSFANDKTPGVYNGSANNDGVLHCSSCGMPRFRPRSTAQHSLFGPSLSPIPSRIRLVRPLSTEFKRSTSTFDEQPENRLTHRRTQSYVPPTTYLQQKSRL